MGKEKLYQVSTLNITFSRIRIIIGMVTSYKKAGFLTTDVVYK
jgi:hypothetical protein